VRRLGAAAALVLALLVAFAQTASAEVPAGSTRSEISGITAGSPPPQVQVIGGDEYIRLTAPPNHEVTVAGYSGEPYLKFDADGTVEENQHSPATVLNADRYGTADVSGYDPHADPQWVSVASGGTYQWHDHRIHSMVTGEAAANVPDGTVFDWTIPITVDGTAGEIRGSLIQASTGIGWLCGIGVVVLTVGGIFIGRRRSLFTARITAAVAAGAAVTVMAGERIAVNGPLVGGVAPLLPPTLAAIAAVAALVLRKPSQQLLAAGAVPIVLSGWILTRVVVMWGAIVVSWWPAAVQRGLMVVATAAAITTGVLALEVWRRQLSRPRVARRAA
jgi:hypothetical protein